MESNHTDIESSMDDQDLSTTNYNYHDDNDNNTTTYDTNDVMILSKDTNNIEMAVEQLMSDVLDRLASSSNRKRDDNGHMININSFHHKSTDDIEHPEIDGMDRNRTFGDERHNIDDDTIKNYQDVDQLSSSNVSDGHLIVEDSHNSIDQSTTTTYDGHISNSDQTLTSKPTELDEKSTKSVIHTKTTDEHEIYQETANKVILAVKMCSLQLIPSDLIYFFCLVKVKNQPFYIKTPQTFDLPNLQIENLETHEIISHQTIKITNDSNISLNATSNDFIPSNVIKNRERETIFVEELLHLGFNHCIALKNSYIITKKKLRDKIDIIIELKSTDFQNMSADSIIENIDSDIFMINTPVGVYLVSRHFEGLSVLLQLFKSVRINDIATILQITSLCSNDINQILRDEFFRVSNDSMIHSITSEMSYQDQDNRFFVEQSLNPSKSESSNSSNINRTSPTYSSDSTSKQRSRRSRSKKHYYHGGSKTNQNLSQRSHRFINIHWLNKKLLAQHQIHLRNKWISWAKFEKLPKDVQNDYLKRNAKSNHNSNVVPRLITNYELKNGYKCANKDQDKSCKYNDAHLQFNSNELNQQFEKLNAKSIRLTSDAQNKLKMFRNVSELNENNETMKIDVKTNDLSDDVQDSDKQLAGPQSSLFQQNSVDSDEMNHDQPIKVDVLQKVPKSIFIDEKAKEACQNHILDNSSEVIKINPFKHMDDEKIKNYHKKSQEAEIMSVDNRNNLLFDIQADCEEEDDDIDIDEELEYHQVQRSDKLDFIHMTNDNKNPLEFDKQHKQVLDIKEIEIKSIPTKDVSDPKQICSKSQIDQNQNDPSVTQSDEFIDDHDDPMKYPNIIISHLNDPKQVPVDNVLPLSSHFDNKKQQQIADDESIKSLKSNRKKKSNSHKLSKIFMINSKISDLQNQDRRSQTMSRSFRDTLNRIFKPGALPTELKITDFGDDSNLSASNGNLQSNNVDDVNKDNISNEIQINGSKQIPSHEDLTKPKKKTFGALKRLFSFH